MAFTEAEAGKIATRLAALVTSSRERFGKLYDESIADGGNVVKDAEPFLSVILDDNFDSPADDRVAFARAFKSSLVSSWYKLLVHKLLKDGALNPQAVKLLAASRNPNGNGAASDDTIVPQAMFDVAAGFGNPERDARGLIFTCPKICHVRVDAGGQTAGGTGFIIGPQTVITAWHVIAPLLDPVTGRETPGSHTRLQVVFDYSEPDFNGKRAERIVYDVVENWLGDHSACHDSERPSDKGIVDPQLAAASVDENHLDFAVIRLKGSPGRMRGVVSLREDFLAIPKDGGVKSIVFQHPRNNPLKYTQGQFFGYFGSGEPPPRLRHRANTDFGSSGGLCTDSEFKAIGLHQATVVNDKGEPVANQAVPVAYIRKKLITAFDVNPEFEPLWQLVDTRAVLQTPVPVIGRDDLQESVWRVARGEKRIISVRAADSRGGLSFSTQILRALLGASDVVIIEMTADEIGRDAVALAERLLRQAGGALEPGENFPSEAEAGTATAAWLRDQLLPDLVARIRKKVGGRQVWIALDHLDRFDIPDDKARSLFLALMAAKIDAPFLRFLLLGARTSLPGIPAEMVEDDSTDWPNQTELRTYVQRYCVANRIQITSQLLDKYASDAAAHALRDADSRRNQWEEAARYLMDKAHPELQKLPRIQ